jgi:hypothetical protein
MRPGLRPFGEAAQKQRPPGILLKSAKELGPCRETRATISAPPLIAGSLGKTRALARRFVHPPTRLTQSVDSRIDLAALAFEVANLRRDLLRRQIHLEFGVAGIRFPASKDVMNLGQREPELPAFKNHLEMKPVAGIVSATGAFPSRVQQAAVLIKPEGPDAHLEIPRHFPDRK